MSFEEPQRINELFANYTGIWAIAGGWAIDLFLNATTRYHKDIEIVIARNEQQKLRDYLPDWTFRYALEGLLLTWNKSHHLVLPIHEIYATAPDGKMQIEILLNEFVYDHWVFRRNPEITYPSAQLITLSRQQIPILAPEIVLLYKAKIDKIKDQADLLNTVPHLAPTALDWLKNAIQSTHPNHDWLTLLETI
ncbi:hypothetical protein GCM10028805_07480 [Spirosoma harenae]